MSNPIGLAWKDVKSLMRDKDLQYFRQYREEPNDDEVIFSNVIAPGQTDWVFYKDGTLWYITANSYKVEWL